MLTVAQKVFIVQCYGLGETISYAGVARMFRQKWPEAAVSENAVKNVIAKFVRTGSTLPMKKKRKSYSEVEDAATSLAMNSVREFPKMSLRRRSCRIGNISKSLLQRIYKHNKIHPFKPRFIHTLEENDEAKRLYFCLLIGEKMLQNRTFYHNIIFSDEATFTTNGVVSAQNSRYWAGENPNFRIHRRRQYSEKVNVWCAVSYNGVIGPYFFERNLNQHSYLEMLNTFFLDYLSNMSVDDRRKVYFQHDGCPGHSTRVIREWLNLHFRDQWFGRYGSHPWPPRSPDLTIMDFHLWGYLKQKVYAEPLNNDLNTLKERIGAAIAGIPLQQIRSAYKEFKNRIEVCAELGGNTFE